MLLLYLVGREVLLATRPRHEATLVSLSLRFIVYTFQARCLARGAA